jgi:hypothetical protein
MRFSVLYGVYKEGSNDVIEAHKQRLIKGQATETAITEIL